MNSNFREVKATSNTIDEIGVPKEIKKCIIEYIWNGYDSGATKVDINYKLNDTLGYVEELNIIDNGTGIIFEDLDKSFTPILDSQKKDITSSFYTRGKKGKGRFSFISFSNLCKWNTIYELNGKKYSYDITIAQNTKNVYFPANHKEIDESINTGTIVNFLNLDRSISKDFLESQEFINFLKYEFSWFLFLHKNQDFKLTINGNKINYLDIIEDTDQQIIQLEDKNKKKTYSFNINYILWKNKIGEDSQNYYLDSNKKPKWNEDNKTNKKSDGFYNSLYIVSDFFDNFEVIEKKEEKQLGLPNNSTNKYNEFFRELNKILFKILEAKRKEFLLKQGDKLIQKLYDQKVMPIFGKGKYEEIKKEDFECVVKEIYVFEPQIFEKNTNIIQKRTILEFLKLLLDEEKRDALLNILKDILELDQQQTDEFSQILSRTKLSGIIKLTNFLINRKEFLLKLDKLVFDLKVFTKERGHIQEIIEDNNFWLFGEQYHLTSSDDNFKILKEKYLEYTKDQSDSKQKTEGINDRPDIFMVRNREITAHNNSYNKLEHIIVELKRPTQKIGMNQYNQIVKYLEYIKNDAKLGSQLNTWKFYLISNDLDSFITDQYDDYEKYDDPFLIKVHKEIYRIYAMKWSDIFRVFENNNKHLLDQLNVSTQELELSLCVLDKSIESSEKIVKDILGKNK